MQCLLAQAVQKFPFAPALIAGPRTLTYAQFEQSVAAAMGRLTRLGIRPQTRVAIQSPNCPEYLILLVALWRMQAATCLLSTRLPVSALRSQTKILKCKFFFRSLKNLAAISSGKDSPAAALKNISLNQEVTMMLTSGSTGTPKVVVHTYGNHYYSALGSNKNIRVCPQDRWLLSLPLYHVGGLSILFRCLLAGVAMVIPDSTKNLAELIRTFKITHVSVVPTQLYRLLHAQPLNLSSLKAVLVGGAPIPENLIQKSLRRKLPIYITYGLTEMTSQVATSTFADFKKHVVNSARILPYRKLKISQDGEIWVKGKTLFKRYITPRGVTHPIKKGSWFATGDLGSFKKGRLRVWGRKDNMFISGGENIYPEEIEKYLLNLPAIEQAIVVPENDPEFGQRPVAFIKMKKNAALNVKAIEKQLTQFLPRFKVPAAFYHWQQDE